MQGYSSTAEFRRDGMRVSGADRTAPRWSVLVPIRGGGQVVRIHDSKFWNASCSSDRNLWNLASGCFILRPLLLLNGEIFTRTDRQTDESNLQRRQLWYITTKRWGWSAFSFTVGGWFHILCPVTVEFHLLAFILCMWQYFDFRPEHRLLWPAG
jgi:hypothetical protein